MFYQFQFTRKFTSFLTRPISNFKGGSIALYICSRTTLESTVLFITSTSQFPNHRQSVSFVVNWALNIASCRRLGPRAPNADTTHTSSLTVGSINARFELIPWTFFAMAFPSRGYKKIWKIKIEYYVTMERERNRSIIVHTFSLPTHSRTHTQSRAGRMGRKKVSAEKAHAMGKFCSAQNFRVQRKKAQSSAWCGCGELFCERQREKSPCIVRHGRVMYDRKYVINIYRGHEAEWLYESARRTSELANVKRPRARLEQGDVSERADELWTIYLCNIVYAIISSMNQT